jgi:PBP1b-binding outer membrane lipoprotein LpoB
MKIALLLSIVSAALVFGGCASNRGGMSDTYEQSSGTMQNGPEMVDPSLPQDPNAGPSMTPP